MAGRAGRRTPAPKTPDHRAARSSRAVPCAGTAKRRADHWPIPNSLTVPSRPTSARSSPRQGQAGTAVARLYGDGRLAWFARLRPHDFADPVHQAVYAALASRTLPERGGVAGAYDRLRARLTRLLSPRARSAAAYMAAARAVPGPGQHARLRRHGRRGQPSPRRCRSRRHGTLAAGTAAADDRREPSAGQRQPVARHLSRRPAPARHPAGRPGRTPPRHPRQAAHRTAWTGRPRGSPGH